MILIQMPAPQVYTAHIFFEKDIVEKNGEIMEKNRVSIV